MFLETYLNTIDMNYLKFWKWRESVLIVATWHVLIHLRSHYNSPRKIYRVQKIFHHYILQYFYSKTPTGSMTQGVNFTVHNPFNVWKPKQHKQKISSLMLLLQAVPQFDFLILKTLEIQFFRNIQSQKGKKLHREQFY